VKGVAQMAEFFPNSSRSFEPYRGFDNAYPDGDASIARLVGPKTSGTLGGGVVTYRRVRTTWHLPFDEIVCVLAGEMTVRAHGNIWHAGPGDVLFFAKAEPIEYDVEHEVTVFYAKYPVTAST
jgi:ethanolamine utilization protein EutQ